MARLSATLLLAAAFAFAWAPASAAAFECGFAGARADLGARGGRPADTDSFIESDRYPLLVHTPVWFDADEAQLLLDELEGAWARNVDWGMEPPPPDGRDVDDRFDVYVSQTEFGGYVAPEDWFEGDGGLGCISHLVLNRDIPLQEGLLAIVHHELHHAFQSATDCVESVGLLESDATFVADWTVPEMPLGMYGSVPEFQRTPDRALNDAEWGMPWQYGVSLWRWFLAERYGDGTPAFSASLWTGGRQPGFENEPDWFDVLGELLRDQGSSRAEAFTEFAIWRLLTGERASEHAPWARSQEWPAEITLQVHDVVRVGDLPREDAAGPVEVGLFGSAYVEVTLGESTGRLLAQVRPDADEPWTASLLGLRPDGSWQESRLEDLSGGFEIDGSYESVFLIVNRVPDHDPDLYEEWGDDRAGFHFDLGWERDEPVEVGDDDDSGVGAGCRGCATAGGRPVGWSGLLLLGCCRRRSRHAARPGA